MSVMLSPAEVERGWVEHHCDQHGFLVATVPSARVNCRCGRVARILRHGRLVNDGLKPTGAKPRELNTAGKPYAHRCGDCGVDFGGQTIFKSHRVGGKLNKRCLTPEDMTARGWRLTERGRWS